MSSQYTEVADVVVVDDVPLSTVRFYDGRILADSFAETTVPFVGFQELKESVADRFSRLVRGSNPGLKSVAISHSEDNKNETKETVSGLEMEVKLGDNVPPGIELSATLTWDAAADTVTLERPSFNVTWGEWLLWIKWIQDFCATISAYKGGM